MFGGVFRRNESYIRKIIFIVVNWNLQKVNKILIGKGEIYYYLNQRYLEMILIDLYKKLMVHGLILLVTWHIMHIKFLENLMF